MSDDLHDLAKAAEAKAGGPVDFDALVKQGVESYRKLKLCTMTLFAGDIWKSYAAELGKDELTDEEKRQAVLDDVLRRSS